MSNLLDIYGHGVQFVMHAKMCVLSENFSNNSNKHSKQRLMLALCFPIRQLVFRYPRLRTCKTLDPEDDLKFRDFIKVLVLPMAKKKKESMF